MHNIILTFCPWYILFRIVFSLEFIVMCPQLEHTLNKANGELAILMFGIDVYFTIRKARIIARTCKIKQFTLYKRNFVYKKTTLEDGFPSCLLF